MANQIANQIAVKTYRAQGRTHVPVKQQGLTPVLGADGKWTYTAHPDANLLDTTKQELETIRQTAITAIATAATASDDAKAAGDRVASMATLDDVSSAVGTKFENTFLVQSDQYGALVVDNVSFYEDEDGWKMNICVKRKSFIIENDSYGFCGIIGYASRSEFAELERRIADLEARLEAAEKRLPAQKA